MPVKILKLDAVQSAMREGAQIVDLRAAFEYAGGRIPESANFPGRSIESRSNLLSKDRPVVLVAGENEHITEMAQLFESLGFLDISYLEGGFDAWENAGLPIETISDGMGAGFGHG